MTRYLKSSYFFGYTVGPGVARMAPVEKVSLGEQGW